MRYALALAALLLTACGAGDAASCGPGDYRRAAGALWPGVRVYYGPDHNPLGRVVRVEREHRFPDGVVRRAVQIADDAGSVYWMRRDVLLDEAYQVRCDDPAMPR